MNWIAFVIPMLFVWLGMGFLRNCKYPLASVFASVYSMVSGNGCTDWVIFEFKKYNKVQNSL
jgi:hypothetical protein